MTIDTKLATELTVASSSAFDKVIAGNGAALVSVTPAALAARVGSDMGRRDIATATAVATALSDGEIGVIAGLSYLKDSAATGSLSCTNDLGVSGLVPHGTITMAHYGVAADDTPTNDDTAALQAALDRSALTGTPVCLDGNFRISSSVSVPPGATPSISRTATLKPTSGFMPDPAVIFESGNSVGRRDMPSFSGFTGVCADIRCALSEIYVPQVNTCGTAFKFNTVDGNVLDTVVKFDAISACDVAVEFNLATAARAIQGCGAVGNFITNTTDGVIFTGSAGADDGLFLDVLAADFTDTRPGGAVMDNRITSHQVPRFTLTVRSWFGGAGFSDASPTQIAKGIWANPTYDVADARSFTQANLGSNLLRGAYVRHRQRNPAAAVVAMQEATPDLATFNGGTMLYHNEMVLRATLGSSLPAGNSRSFYFYNIFADGNYQPWLSNIIAGNTGLFVSRVIDQSLIEAGLVHVLVRNDSAAAIAAGQTLDIRVSRA